MFPPAGSPPPINSFPASAVLTVGRSGKPAFNTTAAAPVLAQTIMVPSFHHGALIEPADPVKGRQATVFDILDHDIQKGPVWNTVRLAGDMPTR